MELFNLQVVILTLISLALSVIGIWSARHGAARLAMLTLFGVLVGSIFAASASFLGRAKPVDLTWLQPQIEDAVVISGHLMEGRGIYLTLALAQNTPPQLYVLPWDQKTAEQLQKAMHEAEQNGTEAMMRKPLQKASNEQDEALFYTKPQAAPEPKPVPQAGIKLS